MNYYKFNEHDVCINPTIIYKSNCAKVELEIRLAALFQYWESSVSHQVGYSGGGYLPSKNHILKHKETREVAIEKGYIRARTDLKYLLNDPNGCKPKSLDKYIIKEIKSLDRWFRNIKNKEFNEYYIQQLNSTVELVQGSLF